MPLHYGMSKNKWFRKQVFAEPFLYVYSQVYLTLSARACHRLSSGTGAVMSIG